MLASEKLNVCEHSLVNMQSTYMNYGSLIFITLIVFITSLNLSYFKCILS